MPQINVNTDQFSPVVGPELAYDADLSPTLRGVDINAAGVLVVEDIWDKQAIYTTVAENLPYRVELQIKKIVGDGSGGVGNGTTGTSLALTALVPLA